MANYTIIGGDNKEYGPVSAAEVHQWISEGRLNAESRIKAESDAEYRVLGLYPEFAEALRAQAAPGTIAPQPAADDYLERDYELDIGGCIVRGYELLKENFGTLFGAFIIMFLVIMAAGGAIGFIAGLFGKVLVHSPIAVKLALGYVTSALMALVTGPLIGGLNLVNLRKIRGETTGVGDVFVGFQQGFSQLFLGQLILTLVNGLWMLPFQYVWQTKTATVQEQMQNMQSDPTVAQQILPQFMSAATSAGPVGLICLIPVTFFTVSWLFTLALIVDKQMGFGAAMKTSWKMVMRHWWLVLGLYIVTGLVTCSGALACCIGFLFTAPIGVATLMYAYETIFGARKN